MRTIYGLIVFLLGMKLVSHGWKKIDRKYQNKLFDELYQKLTNDREFMTMLKMVKAESHAPSPEAD